MIFYFLFWGILDILSFLTYFVSRFVLAVILLLYIFYLSCLDFHEYTSIFNLLKHKYLSNVWPQFSLWKNWVEISVFICNKMVLSLLYGTGKDYERSIVKTSCIFFCCILCIFCCFMHLFPGKGVIVYQLSVSFIP